MSVSLNPTKLPDIVSHVGVCFLFFFLEVDNCLERLHQLKQKEGSKKHSLAVPVPREHLYFLN